MARTKVRADQAVEDTLEDKDGNTKIAVEESNNEDMIRFDTAGTERMIIRNDGRVGIGVSTGLPNVGLTVDGSSIPSSVGDISIAEKMTHKGDSDTYVQFPTNDKVALVAGGDTKIEVESLGGNEGTIRYTMGGTEKLMFDSQGTIIAVGGTLGVASSQSINVKSLQGTATTTAVLEDTTFSGLGANSFTVSCWFYQNDTNSDPISTNTRIRFLQSSTERHVLDLRFPDVAITMENTSSVSDSEDYDTNLEEQRWYHIVASFDANLSGGSPKLWVDGIEVSGSNYTGPTGTAPDISRVTVYLDDGTAMHDLIFWDKILSDDEVDELYNEGYYFDPMMHSSSNSIVSFFELGEESALDSFNNGDQLSGTINLDDTNSPSVNSFTLTQESEFSILEHAMEEILSPGLEIQGNSLKITNQFTPQSATDMGTTGEIAWDSNYIYVCVDTNTWKRVALSTW